MREHRQPAVGSARPLLGRPIPIELDAVVVGIAQIKRFAHAVVGGALERDLGFDEPAQRIGEARAGRIQNRQMIEAGGTERRWCAAAALPGIEPDMMMIAARGNERRLRTDALHQVETEHAAIKGERAIDVGDLEMDVTDAHSAVDRRAGLVKRNWIASIIAHQFAFAVTLRVSGATRKAVMRLRDLRKT